MTAAKKNPMRTAYVPGAEPNQRIYTPTELLEKIVLKTWPEGIAYDPFPGPMAPASLLAARCCTGDGFAEPLVNRSFGNPPFARLKEAMIQFDHAARIAQSACDDGLILLAPAQTHRAWFWAHRGNAIAWLRPLKFVGFDNTFPKPLCLHYWGDRYNRFANAAADSGLVVHVSGYGALS